MWTQEDLAAAARFNDWAAWISIEAERADAQGQRWLLIRRNPTGELAYYRCWRPEPVPLRELVRVAGVAPRSPADSLRFAASRRQ